MYPAAGGARLTPPRHQNRDLEKVDRRALRGSSVGPRECLLSARFSRSRLLADWAAKGPKPDLGLVRAQPSSAPGLTEYPRASGGHAGLDRRRAWPPGRSILPCQAANLARNCGLRCRPDRVLHSACFIESFEIARIQTFAGTPNSGGNQPFFYDFEAGILKMKYQTIKKNSVAEPICGGASGSKECLDAPLA
jgi:hypothetical protein